MTEEAKKFLELLRYIGEKNICKRGKPPHIDTFGDLYIEDMFAKAADLIESLSAQLEQVTRERDAAIRDMQKTPITLCAACSHYHTEFCCAGGEGCEDICMTIACSMFEWRNIQEEG